MATTAATLDRIATRQRPSVGFGATLRSEWTKLISTRSTYLMLGLAAALGLAMTALLSLAVGSSWSDLTAADKATWEPVTFSLVGLLFGAILLTVLGVLVVSSEYTSGMIRTTLTATPQRGRLLAAKIVLISAISMVATLVLTIGVLLTGIWVLGAYDVPTFALGDADVIRTIIAVTLTAPLYPLIGVAFAILFRSTATPLTLVLALMFVPSMFGGSSRAGGRRMSSACCLARPPTASRSPTSRIRRCSCRRGLPQPSSPTGWWWPSRRLTSR